MNAYFSHSSIARLRKKSTSRTRARGSVAFSQIYLKLRHCFSDFKAVSPLKNEKIYDS